MDPSGVQNSVVKTGKLKPKVKQIEKNISNSYISYHYPSHTQKLLLPDITLFVGIPTI